MDPKACFQRIVQAIEDENGVELDEAMQDLWNWCSRGGFMPTVGTRDLGLVAHRVTDAFGQVAVLRRRIKIMSSSEAIVIEPRFLPKRDIVVMQGFDHEGRLINEFQFEQPEDET